MASITSHVSLYVFLIQLFIALQCCPTCVVMYTITLCTYLVEGDDFTVMSPDVFEATFMSGSMIGDTACDNIKIVNDSVLEGTQSFSIQISGSTPSGGQIMSAGPSTDVFIVDNEGTHCITFVTKKLCQ